MEVVYRSESFTAASTPC